MTNDNKRKPKYAIKIHMMNGTHTVGPYDDFSQAQQDMFDIGDGILTTMKTQRGTTIYLSDKPVVVEIVQFFDKPKESHRGTKDADDKDGQR